MTPLRYASSIAPVDWPTAFLSLTWISRTRSVTPAGILPLLSFSARLRYPGSPMVISQTARAGFPCARPGLVVDMRTDLRSPRTGHH